MSQVFGEMAHHMVLKRGQVAVGTLSLEEAFHSFRELLITHDNFGRNEGNVWFPIRSDKQLFRVEVVNCSGVKDFGVEVPPKAFEGDVEFEVVGSVALMETEIQAKVEQ